MNREQIKACRKANIERLAQLGDGDVDKAHNLYNRCVRFCLRYFRWGEARANGPSHYTKWHWERHEHEGNLLADLGKRLDNELKAYGFEWEYPGLYPVIIDRNGNHPIELIWY